VLQGWANFGIGTLLIGAVLLGVLTSVVLRRRPAHAA
jgi:hypothetical protein